jgi:hypothetical protein
MAGASFADFGSRFFLSLGTTYSCVATYEGSNVEIIANEQGSFTTPSFVSFTEEERLIGEAAKNQAAMNPANTIFDVKYVFCSAWSARLQCLAISINSWFPLGVSLADASKTLP